MLLANSCTIDNRMENLSGKDACILFKKYTYPAFQYCLLTHSCRLPLVISLWGKSPSPS